MGGYKNGKVEIFYGDSPPANLNILWQKRIVTNDVESSELMQYNNNLAVWESLKNTTIQDQLDEINSLNGTNYVMVYGVGTPEENAVELQAAYDAAKTMPRYIGEVSNATNDNYYKGQTAYITETSEYVLLLIDIINNTIDSDVLGYEVLSTEAEAKSVRTTVIVAPGDYTGDSEFVHTESGIVIATLTGNADVIIFGGIAYEFSKDATRQYTDNAAATTAGLSAGEYYNTDGIVKIVF